ncbi:MAG TPA: hypothetical protein DCZ91_11310, partial [Lachnospiraceae bacterium]|nr:hypothetical protein [Lachnospiraceae bacterium]
TETGYAICAGTLYIVRTVWRQEPEEIATYRTGTARTGTTRTETGYVIYAGTLYIVRTVPGMRSRAAEMRHLRTVAAQRGARGRITADMVPDVMTPVIMAAETAVRDIMAQGITEAVIIDNGNRKERRQPQGCSRFFRFPCWRKIGGHFPVIFRQFLAGEKSGIACAGETQG